MRRELFDIPNERSSHVIPTPRGGGLVIVILSLTGYLLYGIFIAESSNWAYVLGAILIAFISWFDDLHSISFYWRFLAHSVAALFLIYTSGYFQEIYFPLIGRIELGEIGAILTFLWIVWLTNAYNFMDGIDGIAGIQAVVAGIGWLIIGKFFGLETVGFYGGVIASSSLGFLILNWQPAKIFMGDVGSAFLGYSFAVLPLLARDQTSNSAQHFGFLSVTAVLVVWLFVYDTIYTFVRRLLNKERVWEAHRGHIYQKLVINGFSHQTVAMFYGALSILTIAVLILWTIQNDVWAIVLISLVLFQSIGLIFCPLILRKNPIGLGK